MNGNMRNYSEEIETKLDACYKIMGGVKKHGYDATAAKSGSIEEFMEVDKLMGGIMMADRK